LAGITNYLELRGRDFLLLSLPSLTAPPRNTPANERAILPGAPPMPGNHAEMWSRMIIEVPSF